MLSTLALLEIVRISDKVTKTLSRYVWLRNLVIKAATNINNLYKKKKYLSLLMSTSQKETLGNGVNLMVWNRLIPIWTDAND